MKINIIFFLFHNSTLSVLKIIESFKCFFFAEKSVTNPPINKVGSYKLD